ncbi:circadian clock KaiB family protein [Prosthecobacter sp.]|jgi:circadian clock protein KaiB|uniref:circadian clock KaiB family protein n=1 Tax=Prosthecobacter sp. TaxID=1965333 RepID=UPI0037CA2F30
MKPASKTVKAKKISRTKLAAKKKSPALQSAGQYVLRLFVAGASARSHQAVMRVRELCATVLEDNCTLEVIDIYQQPALARTHQIVATPTLIVELPQPARRFIGNLTNITGLFVELNLSTKVKVSL